MGRLDTVTVDADEVRAKTHLLAEKLTAAVRDFLEEHVEVFGVDQLVYTGALVAISELQGSFITQAKICGVKEEVIGRAIQIGMAKGLGISLELDEDSDDVPSLNRSRA